MRVSIGHNPHTHNATHHGGCAGVSGSSCLDSFSVTVLPTVATGILQLTPRMPVLPGHVSSHPFLQLVVENMQGPLRFKLVDKMLVSYSGKVAQKTIDLLHFI